MNRYTPMKIPEETRMSRPYLFIDDHLIAESSGVVRTEHRPTKLPEPVLDSKTFGVTQPYMTVQSNLDSQAQGELRIWYCRGTEVWQALSNDGISWHTPTCAYPRARGYGAAVVDDLGRDSDPSRRYKLADWQFTRALGGTDRDDSGMYVQFSGDGIHWTQVPNNTVLPSWPEGSGHVEACGPSDIIEAFWDPLHGRYSAAVKLWAGPQDPWSRATRAGEVVTRRLVGMTCSSDFVTWVQPWRIFVPDEEDDGDMEFYGMGGVHARGDLLIGFVRVLRDDLPCDEGSSPDGIGYTVLGWSRDGVNWTRGREPFLDRGSEPGSWDHAMVWGSSALQRGNEVLIYYGGYARGHKIGRATERQIGLARLPVDRYVSRDAGPGGGRLVTSPIELEGPSLTVNAEVRGEMRVRIVDEAGAPISGCDWDDCRTIRGDSLEHRVDWAGTTPPVPEGPVRIEFQMRDTKVYGFSAHSKV
jgi:hypothetical protein